MTIPNRQAEEKKGRMETGKFKVCSAPNYKNGAYTDDWRIDLEWRDGGLLVRKPVADVWGRANAKRIAETLNVMKVPIGKAKLGVIKWPPRKRKASAQH
jgi:hypothetical protein